MHSFRVCEAVEYTWELPLREEGGFLWFCGGVRCWYHESAQIPYSDIYGLVLAHDTKIWGLDTPGLGVGYWVPLIF